MSTFGKRLVKTGLVALVIAVPVVGYMQRWNIYDATRLRGYVAPPEVAQLATDTTMNDKMRRLFYVYHPDLEDKKSFNANCKSSEKTIVLGCYISGTGIYLFKVTDERLAGVTQVTAAHESLHAAYDRLSSGDKQHVNTLIDQTYAKVTDQRIRDTIDSYKKAGADTTNELHSILGTEVRDLPPELEQYYTRYFTNRKAIVAYSEKYEQAFNERRDKIAADDAQLDSLKKQIDDGQARLGSQLDALNSSRARLDAQLAAKDYQGYNAGVSGYNGQVNAYNAEVRRVRGLIDSYNDLVAARNAIATEEGELVKAIDSRPDTIQTQ